MNISWECSTNIPRTCICPEDIEYKSNSDRNKTLSVEEYLNEIRLYLKDILNNPEESDTWKIQLAITIIFISSIDNDEEHVIHLNSYNLETKINDNFWISENKMSK